MADQSILGADLLLRLGIDASGVQTELSSKMTAVERQAVAQGAKISDAYGRANDKVVASQLRVVAAQEKVNKLIASEKATLSQRATAASGLISAQQRYNTELTKTATTTATVVKAEQSRFSGLKSSLAAGIGFAGASTLFDTLRQAKDAAVEYQDVVSANDVTFGRQRVQLERFKRLQADQLNLSKLQVEQSASVFGQVFRSAGAGQGQALEQGLALTQRAADVRSFRGGTLQNVQDAFRSALVGETEPIRKYGVLLDDARLRLRAFNMGLVATTKETLPPAVKAQAAYAEILAQTSRAAGDVARTSDSAANKIEDQRQKAADAKQVLGEGLLPVITELATAGAELAPALGSVARGIGAVLGNDVARRSLEFGALALGVSKLGGALNGFVNRSQEKISQNLAVARSYDAVAGSATRAAVAEGRASGVGVGGRFSGGRGQLAAFGGLGLLAAGTGAVGAASGSGGLNTAANILSGAATGAGIGSFFPGAGTLIGGAIGATAGLGLSIFGPSGASGPTTSRTPAQVKADLREVNAALAKLRGAPNASTIQGAYANQGRGANLMQRQKSLSEELKSAREQAKQTFQTFDQGTGTFKNMTTAQIAAASAAAEHSKQLEAQRKAFSDLRDSLAVDPFSGAADTSKALSPAAVRRRMDASLDRARQTRRDFASIAGRGASRESLDALRGLEAEAPGTVHRLAQQTGRGFVRELRRELRQLGRQASVTAHLFDNAPDEAEKAARRAARRAAAAARDEMNEYFRHNPPQFTFATPGNVPFLPAANQVNRRRRQP